LLGACFCKGPTDDHFDVSRRRRCGNSDRACAAFVGDKVTFKANLLRARVNYRF
jgi:hypothetical protein